MSKMIAIKRVILTDRPLQPSRTRHTLSDSQGTREFVPFASLEISQASGEPGYYLLRLCENGQCADTWYEILDDTFHQAKYEFGVRPEEWAEANEPF